MSVFDTAPRIMPFLWFDRNAEEAVDFYLTVFRNARRLDIMRTGPMPQNPGGGVLTIAFELDGQRFVALNGGPMFRFTEAVSFVVRLRLAGGGRRVLVQARGRRLGRPLRLVEGPFRPIVAGDSHALWS